MAVLHYPNMHCIPFLWRKTNKQPITAVFLWQCKSYGEIKKTQRACGSDLSVASGLSQSSSSSSKSDVLRKLKLSRAVSTVRLMLEARLRLRPYTDTQTQFYYLNLLQTCYPKYSAARGIIANQYHLLNISEQFVNWTSMATFSLGQKKLRISRVKDF